MVRALAHEGVQEGTQCFSRAGRGQCARRPFSHAVPWGRKLRRVSPHVRLPRTFNYILRELPKVPTHVPVCVLGNYRDMGEHRVILPDDARDFIDNLDRWVPARRRCCCGRPVRLGRSCLCPPLPRALAAHPAARPRLPGCASSPGFPAPPGPHPAPPGWGRRPGGWGVGGQDRGWAPGFLALSSPRCQVGAASLHL